MMLRRYLSKALSDYGMIIVLLFLCVYYSFATIQRRGTEGVEGATSVAQQVLSMSHRPKRVLITVGTAATDASFLSEAKARLTSGGIAAVESVTGDPHDLREKLNQLIAANTPPDLMVVTTQASPWVQRVSQQLPGIDGLPLIEPKQSSWPTFLNEDNLLNVGDEIAVIAIMAVGMTMVIITGGIDLSVGSLIALSAVVTSILIRDNAGGALATTRGLILCSLAGIAVCGLVGLLSGLMITIFDVPPFIITLSMMKVASGLAFRWSDHQSIHDIPAAFTWLGRGTSIFGIPNTLLLMILLFAAAHVMLSRMRLGRYIYAIGGNAEASRLSGINVRGVVLIVYVISGLTAGLGGVIMTSRLQAGAPQYGLSYELSVIAAVVLGGTSLAGGEGNVIGTLIGALIIAVMNDGMNLTGVDSANQDIALGLVILGAVLIDRLKRRSWKWPGWFSLRSKAQSISVKETV
jgi:ribose transport system permease protein